MIASFSRDEDFSRGNEVISMQMIFLFYLFFPGGSFLNRRFSGKHTFCSFSPQIHSM